MTANTLYFHKISSMKRYQAMSLPLVSRAELDMSTFAGRQTQYMPEIEHIKDCPEALLPHPEWENEVIDDFSQLRELLYKLSLSEETRERKVAVPSLRDSPSWHLFCFNKPINIAGSIVSSRLVVDDQDDASSCSIEDLLEQRKLEISKAADIDGNFVVLTLNNLLMLTLILTIQHRRKSRTALSTTVKTVPPS